MTIIYGGDGADTVVGGNSGDQAYLRGGDDTFTGGDGNDILRGHDGADSLYGGAGADQLDGGLGADVLAGGIGNDTYVVDDVGDLVIEATGEGVDTVKASISYLLTDNLENLLLFGTGNIDGFGNAGRNAIKGNVGANHLYGGGGDDGIDAGDGNDWVVGGSGNDWLSGGTGVDWLSYEDATSAVTVSLAINTTTQNTGGGGRDLAFGFENLMGSAFNDTLTGDAGANRINGGLGVDLMSGGGGNDIYSVDNVGDVVTELAGEGIDLVLASADFTLGANIENLSLFGAAVSGTGNGLANIIAGNANGNILNGKGGHDSLLGSTGADTFVFDAPDGTSADNVRDFAHGLDKIAISAATFGGGLTGGQVLDSDWFVIATSAMPVDTGVDRYTSTSNPFATTAAHGQFIFDSYQQLWWDADGSGAGAAVMVAGFGATPAAVVDWTDIIVGP